MHRLALTDAFFLMNEIRPAPMHVGGVNLFTLPEGADEQEFLSHLGKILRQEGPLRRPFGERLKTGPLGVAGPLYWEPGTLLDRNRPLWEMHLIEGLHKRRFATYMKAHHCAIDGIGAMHLTQSMMSSTPRTRIRYSPFSVEAHEAYRRKLGARKSRVQEPAPRELRAVAARRPTRAG